MKVARAFLAFFIGVLLLSSPAFAAKIWSGRTGVWHSSLQPALDDAVALTEEQNPGYSYRCREVQPAFDRCLADRRGSDGVWRDAGIIGTIWKEGPTCGPGQVLSSDGTQCVNEPVDPNDKKCTELARTFNSRSNDNRSFSYSGAAPSSVVCQALDPGVTKEYWNTRDPENGVFWFEPFGSGFGCKVDVRADMSVTYGDPPRTSSVGPGWMRSGKGSACDLSREGTGTSEEDGDPDSDNTSGNGENDPCPRGYPGEINGESVCVPFAGNPDTTTSETTNTHSEGTNPDGTPNNSTTSSSTQCKGDSCTTTTSTTNSSGTTTSTTTTSRGDFCAKNPRSSLCGNNYDPSGEGRGDRDGLGGGTAGGGGGGGGGKVTCDSTNTCDDNDAGGGLPSKPGLWEAKYPQGLSGVWDQRKQQLTAAPLGQLAGQLLPGFNGGSPPSWTFDFDFGPLGNFGQHQLTPDSNIWGMLRAIVIVSALIFAFRLVFGGA